MQIKVVTRYTTLQKIFKKTTRQLPKDIENYQYSRFSDKNKYCKNMVWHKSHKVVKLFNILSSEKMDNKSCH